MALPGIFTINNNQVSTHISCEFLLIVCRTIYKILWKNVASVDLT